MTNNNDTTTAGMTISTKESRNVICNNVGNRKENSKTKRNANYTAKKYDGHCTHVCPLQRSVQKKTQSIGSRGRHVTTRSRVSAEAEPASLAQATVTSLGVTSLRPRRMRRLERS